MGEFERTRPVSEECERCGTSVVFQPGDKIPDVILCPNCQ